MAKKVKFGWLKDKLGERFAPKTFTSLVFNKNGKSLEKILEELPQNGGGGNGRPGNDGFSPEAKVEKTEDGAKITITDKSGTTEATVKHGKDGKTPIKGTDYFTESDKAELVADVLNALPTWQGGAY